MDPLLRSALPLSVNLNRYATKVATHIMFLRHFRTFQERGVAGLHPRTRGRSPVVLKVRFRSRAFLKAEIQSEIVPGYLHYLRFCTIQRLVVHSILPVGTRRQSEGIEKYPGNGSEEVNKTGSWREY